MAAQLDSPAVILDRRTAGQAIAATRRAIVATRRSGSSPKQAIWLCGWLCLCAVLVWNTTPVRNTPQTRPNSWPNSWLPSHTANRLLAGQSAGERSQFEQASAANSDATGGRQSPFQLPSYIKEPRQTISTAAVVLTAENRPDGRQEDQKSNPALGSTKQPKLIPASGPMAVPMLTTQQADQIFDPPQAQPLLPLAIRRPGFGPAVPILYLPLEATQSGQADPDQSQANNPEADIRQDALSANTTPAARPLPLQADSATAGATNDLAPLVPLDHEDLASVRPALLSEQDTAEQLTPSDEITPLPEVVKASSKTRPPTSLAANATKPTVTAAGTGKSTADNTAEKSETTRSVEPVAPWPKPSFLLERVAAVRFIPGLIAWTERTTELLEDLHQVPSLSDRSIIPILGELEQQNAMLEPLVIRFSSVATSNADEALGPESLELRRLAYKLRQQIDVWYATHELAVKNLSSLGDSDSVLVVQGLQVSRQRLALPTVSPEWERYLVLDQVESAFNSIQSTPQEKRTAARRFLARLHSPILTDEQRGFLSQQVDAELVEQLKTATREDIRLENLLTEIEALQENRNGVAQHRVNQMFQNLAWHDDSAARELASTLDTHFRNANFRISVSAEMLNLLLPDQGEVAEPVNENVFGAEVRGQSRVANRLQIRLIPDTSRIQMRLEAIGKVLSQTEAQRSGFTVQSEGDARFQVFKRLAIGREGIISDQPEAWSRASNRMVGMQSELDGVPVLGWVARRVAERKIAEQSPQVENYTRRRLESTIKHRFNTEIESQLSDMQSYLSSNMIQPLTALELEPTPLEMRSTDSRVIMRYRLAGFDQMGGNTARPRGLQNCLMSMQIHETSINNLLNRIDLNGKEYTSEELTAHLSNVFGWQPTESAQARDATFEFAPFDPIRITFSHGAAAVQLNLKRLRIGNGKTWKNLTATCNFIPQAEGGKIVFVQDGSGVELSGHRLNLRDQVAVRAIFTALFKDQYELPILPKNIAQKLGPSATITQLELNDGWIGLSIDRSENLTPQRVTELEGPRQGGR